MSIIENSDNRKLCMDICLDIDTNPYISDGTNNGNEILKYLENKMPNFKFIWGNDGSCVSIDCKFNKEDEKYVYAFSAKDKGQEKKCI